MKQHYGGWSFLRFFLSKPQNEFPGGFWDFLVVVPRDLVLVLEESETLVHLDECGKSSPHLEKDESQRVHVRQEVVPALTLPLLGRHVGRRADPHRVLGRARGGRPQCVQVVLRLLAQRVEDAPDLCDLGFLFELGELRLLELGELIGCELAILALVVVVMSGETEVAQLDVVVLVQEDVGWL